MGGENSGRKGKSPKYVWEKLVLWIRILRTELRLWFRIQISDPDLDLSEIG